jgi:hypothetical protein
MHRPINPPVKEPSVRIDLETAWFPFLVWTVWKKKKNLLPLAGFELSADRITTAVYRVLRHGIDLPNAYSLTIDHTKWRYHCLLDIEVSRSINNSNNKHRLTGVPMRIHFMFYILCFTYRYSIV